MPGEPPRRDGRRRCRRPGRRRVCDPRLAASARCCSRRRRRGSCASPMWTDDLDRCAGGARPARLAARARDSRRARRAAGASSSSTSRGAASDFELPLDWRLTRGFGRRVLEATATHPLSARSRPTSAWLPRRAARGLARRRQRARRQPAADRRALPPGAAHDRRPRGVYGRTRAQGVAARRRGRRCLSASSVTGRYRSVMAVSEQAAGAARPAAAGSARPADLRRADARAADGIARSDDRLDGAAHDRRRPRRGLEASPGS